MERVKVLQVGFWEKTTVVRDANGGLSVRKQSTDAGSRSPWGLSALREEIRFLRGLSKKALQYYPPLLEAWDQPSDVGYRIPYYADYRDVSSLLREGRFLQREADEMQALLAEAVFDLTHERLDRGSIVPHLKETIETAISSLTKLPKLSSCIVDSTIELNGQELPGLAAAYELSVNSNAMTALESLPSYRLHGDLILENILWNPTGGPRLRLIDPVSVAGISCGPAAFDLVKYASYATGELFALRSGIIEAGPLPGGTGAFVYKVPRVAAFADTDLSSSFSREFERRHGPRNTGVEHLLDSYFSLVMAVNTQGVQQWGRVLKGIQALTAAAGH